MQPDGNDIPTILELSKKVKTLASNALQENLLASVEPIQSDCSNSQSSDEEQHQSIPMDRSRERLERKSRKRKCRKLKLKVWFTMDMKAGWGLSGMGGMADTFFCMHCDAQKGPKACFFCMIKTAEGDTFSLIARLTDCFPEDIMGMSSQDDELWEEGYKENTGGQGREMSPGLPRILIRGGREVLNGNAGQGQTCSSTTGLL